LPHIESYRPGRNITQIANHARTRLGIATVTIRPDVPLEVANHIVQGIHALHRAGYLAGLRELVISDSEFKGEHFGRMGRFFQIGCASRSTRMPISCNT